MNVIDTKEGGIFVVSEVNMPMMCEKNKSEVSIKEMYQILRATNVGKAHGADECRPKYLNKGGVSVKE